MMEQCAIYFGLILMVSVARLPEELLLSDIFGLDRDTRLGYLT